MSLIVAEYMCPEHGRFERIVERDANGDPPAAVECEEAVEVDAPAVWDGGVPGNPMPFSCGEIAPLVISAPKTKKTWGAAASTMRTGERPPNTLDTRPLADGMKKTEWDAMNAKKRHERQWKRRKERA